MKVKLESFLCLLIWKRGKRVSVSLLTTSNLHRDVFSRRRKYIQVEHLSSDESSELQIAFKIYGLNVLTDEKANIKVSILETDS